MKRYGYSLLGAFLWFIVPVSAQGAPPVIEESGVIQRTITAQLKPARPKRVVQLHYNDEAGRICFDSWQLEATRTEIVAGDTVTFRVRSARRCAEKALRAPQIQRAAWSVRSIGGRNKSSDKSETVTPQSSSFAFSHVFSEPGSYIVTVQNRVDELEVHTVSVNVIVMERPANAIEQQNTE